MNNRQKNILVWLITWACLLLVILYSPIGSPYLYSPTTYFIPSQGVQFEKGGIQNVHNLGRAGNNDQESSAPDFNTPELGKIAAYPVSGAQNSFNKSVGSTSQGYGQLASDQKNGNSAGSNIGSGGFYSFNSKSSTKNDNAPNSTGFMALTTSLNGSSTNTPFQGVNGYIANTGATDPGNNAPFDDPIPVGDGWGVLILLGACYALTRRNHKEINYR